MKRNQTQSALKTHIWEEESVANNGSCHWNPRREDVKVRTTTATMHLQTRTPRLPHLSPFNDVRGMIVASAFQMRIATQTESASICKETRPHSLSLQLRCSWHYRETPSGAAGVKGTHSTGRRKQTTTLQSSGHGKYGKYGHGIYRSPSRLLKLSRKVAERCCSNSELCSQLHSCHTAAFFNSPMIRPRVKAYRCRLTD
ncbi:hypothetical protein TNCV_2282511 [Trichonephila clavipes]|nr:hypothetical protein TNCV_2282511 [Trichonephila clavipes]